MQKLAETRRCKRRAVVVPPRRLPLMWGSFKSMIAASQPPAPAPAAQANRRTKRTGDVAQDAKALQKTQRTALGDISNRVDGTQQATKRTTRATQPAKPAAQEAPMIPVPPVPKMTTVYPTVAQPQLPPAVVHVEPPLVAEAKGATVPQAMQSPGPCDCSYLSTECA